MHQETSIGILFFSRTAEAEALSKRWLNNYRDDLSTAYILRNKAFNSLTASGFPVCVYDENNQVGSTFGDRIQNAFMDMFARGYSHVVAVGADLPSLGSVDWNSIKAHLLRDGAVVGPDFRGGAYLIGLSKVNFEKTNFADLPWQKRILLEELALQIGKIYLLDPRADINSRTDLKKFSRVGRGLSRLLRAILFVSEDLSIKFRAFIHVALSFRLLPERAPPVIH